MACKEYRVDEESGVERGSAQRSSLRGWERAIVNQTNIGTVSKATLGKLLRDGVECIWAFPSAWISSWTELNWNPPVSLDFSFTVWWYAYFQSKDEEEPEKNLLGVVGTDVRINDIVKLIPNYKVGRHFYFYFLFFYTLYYPFREIRATLPGKSYSSREGSATQSYKCMLGLFMFP